ncbi:MAG: N-acyl-D-amino-acid deacylase family protein, partial [Cyclobacteriaceae bacterium]
MTDRSISIVQNSKKKFLIVFSITMLLGSCQPSQTEYDILFTNGTIIDGLGNPRYTGAVGIKDDRIALPSKINSKVSADTVIDITNKIISPGFIDSHAHIQTTIHQFPVPENFLRQGITTICASLHSGDQPWPLDEYARALDVAPNVAFFAGLNWTRKKVVGLENRPATAVELDSMKYYVEETMKQGALGFSVGLIYVPGMYASTEEVIELAKVAAKYNGIFITHMRNEGSALLQAIRETIRISKEAAIPAQINHFKAAGIAQFGLAGEGLKIIDSARLAGIDIKVDLYAYTASNSYGYILFPSWALDGGTEELAKRLKNPTLRDGILEDMRQIMLKEGTGEDLSLIQFSRIPSAPEFTGMTLEDYVIAKGYPNSLDGGLRALVDLQIAGGFLAIYHEMDEKDVINILKHPESMVATDGDLVDPTSDVFPHPRAFGNFPRVLARYVREQKIITLEQAIQKMTSMPANQIKQYDLGRISQGAYADLIVFDENKIQDKATYPHSREFAEGIDYM